MRTNIIYIALNYKRTLYIEVAYINYLTSNLNIYISKCYGAGAIATKRIYLKSL